MPTLKESLDSAPDLAALRAVLGNVGKVSPELRNQLNKRAQELVDDHAVVEAMNAAADDDARRAVLQDNPVSDDVREFLDEPSKRIADKVRDAAIAAALKQPFTERLRNQRDPGDDANTQNNKDWTA